MFELDTSHRVTVRHATGRDQEELARLAALDSAAAVTVPALVAESDARIVAALPLGSGRPIADPFERTAPLLALLQLRAAQLRGGHSRGAGVRERMRGLLPIPALR